MMMRVWLASFVLLLITGCSKPPVTLEKLSDFVESGPGVSTPEELVTAINAAVKAKDIPAMQRLAYSKPLQNTDKEMLNAQFLSMVNSEVQLVEYYDVPKILADSGMENFAWYVYDPDKHAKYVMPAEESDGAANQVSDKPPAPLAPETPLIPTVNFTGAVIVRMKDVPGKKAAGPHNWFAFPIGNPDGSKSLYIGLLQSPPMTPMPLPNQPNE